MCSCVTLHGCVRSSVFGPFVDSGARQFHRPDAGLPEAQALDQSHYWPAGKSSPPSPLSPLTQPRSQAIPPLLLKPPSLHHPRQQYYSNHRLSSLHDLAEPAPSTAISSSVPTFLNSIATAFHAEGSSRARYTQAALPSARITGAVARP